ncbi:hypothetical protein INR49_018798, partial [Caranx melampygus]
SPPPSHRRFSPSSSAFIIIIIIITIIIIIIIIIITLPLFFSVIYFTKGRFLHLGPSYHLYTGPCRSPPLWPLNHPTLTTS